MPMVIGIDHGYYAIKTPHICFPTGLSVYDYEPYTIQNVLQYAGHFYVCGTGRQTLMKVNVKSYAPHKSCAAVHWRRLL